MIADLDSLTAYSGVAVDGDHHPFVQLRAVSGAEIVLTGQLSPDEARGLAMNILEAACAADHDALLFGLMLERLGDRPAAEQQAAAILRDMRARRGDTG